MFQFVDLIACFLIIFTLLVGVYVIRRVFLSKNTGLRGIFVTGFLTLTVACYFLAIPLSSVRVDMKGASFASVLSHSVYADGIDDENRLRTAVNHFEGANSWVKMDLPEFLEEGKKSYAFKFEGDPQKFAITQLHLYVSGPLGEMRVASIGGDGLLEMLYPINRNVNDVSLEGGDLIIQPGQLGGQPWLKILLYGETGRSLWRAGNHFSMLGVAAMWSALFCLGVLVLVPIPFIIKSARDFEAGRINTIGGRLSSWLVSGSIILIVMTICLLIAEWSLRLYYKDVLSTQASSTYFSNKSAVMFAAEKNNWGYRGRDFKRQPVAGRFRVVVMGDSFSWGRGVFPYTKRFPEVLEKKFNERYGRNIEVINLGVSGMNLHGYTRFVSFVLKTEPDFLLYQWYVNDMDIEYDNEATPKPYTQIIPYESVHKYLHKNSALYYIFERSLAKIQYFLASKESYNDRLRFKYSQGKDRENSVKFLREVLDKIEKGRQKYGIVLFPDTSSLNDVNDYDLGFLHDMVDAECVQREIACLDLRDAYRIFDGRVKDAWVNVFDSHPSEEAHELAADALLEFYGDIWNKMIEKVE